MRYTTPSGWDLLMCLVILVVFFAALAYIEGFAGAAWRDIKQWYVRRKYKRRLAKERKEYR